MLELFTTRVQTTYDHPVWEFSRWTLTPARQLFGGRVINIIPNVDDLEPFSISEESLPRKQMNNLETAMAISLLIPSIIFGLLAKMFCLLIAPGKERSLNYLYETLQKQIEVSVKDDCRAIFFSVHIGTGIGYFNSNPANIDNSYFQKDLIGQQNITRENIYSATQELRDEVSHWLESHSLREGSYLLVKTSSVPSPISHLSANPGLGF